MTQSGRIFGNVLVILLSQICLSLYTQQLLFTWKTFLSLVSFWSLWAIHNTMSCQPQEHSIGCSINNIRGPQATMIQRWCWLSSTNLSHKRLCGFCWIVFHQSNASLTMSSFISSAPQGIGIHFNRPAVKISSRLLLLLLFCISMKAENFSEIQRKRHLLGQNKTFAVEILFFPSGLNLCVWNYSISSPGNVLDIPLIILPFFALEKCLEKKNHFLIGIPVLVSPEMSLTSRCCRRS